MTSESSNNLSSLLTAWAGGDAEALDRVIAIVHPELRRIARMHLHRRTTAQSLESCAVVNELYLRLTRAGGLNLENRAHFLALCSQMMRRILVDHARRRRHLKRGGDAAHVMLDLAHAEVNLPSPNLLDLDRALDSLAGIDLRKVQVVEMRYFAGLSIEEIASVLGVSPETVKRDWRMAKAWLLSELS